MKQPNLSNLTLKQVPSEMFLVLGGNRTPIDSGFDRNADSAFAKRIPENKRCLIGDNNIWSAGKIYDAYTLQSANNYYVFNPNNNVVYLCLGNNADNRIDGTVITSSFIPNHTTPTVVLYDDGYSWMPIFKVDPTQYAFVNDKDLPLYDISINQDYNNFTQKYEPLCGSGVTAFGCCCLYFKEANTDELTNEVYAKGDVSNETIFSDCYECQKLADKLDRQPIFLSGLTAGSIVSSNTGENPLCAATTTINTLYEKLQESKYTFTYGSSNEFAVNLLSNFSSTNGIMSARIDLSNLTTAQRTVSTPNPVVTVIDPIGSGASVRLKTSQIDANSYEVYGIETLEYGQDYVLPDILISGTTQTNPLNDAITLFTFPDNIFESTEILVSGKRYKINFSILSTDISNVSGIDNITKYGVLINPGFTSGNGLAQFTKNSSTITTMEYRVFLGLDSSFPQCDV